MTTRHIPSATYRLQLGPDLDLGAAAGLVAHLSRLGVSDLYLSPFLQTAPGAAHGYAVVDHSGVDAGLGGDEGHRRLVEACEGAGVGMVVDLVPNHMAVSLPANRWFWEVLENGPASRYAPYFDVDWDPPESSTLNKVLLPILGDHYGRELEGGSIRLHHESGRFQIRYHEHVLPASPRSVAVLMHEVTSRSGSDEAAFIARSLASLPPATTTDEGERRRRHADACVLARMVADLTSRPDVSTVVDEVTAAVNDDPDFLDRLLDLQHYRLARWRVANQQLGYRRFFDIDSLIGLRVEDPEVFAESHELVLGWVQAGQVQGLRVDHPDGLRRPGEYLQRLREAAPGCWLVVEKILEGEEELPDWPVDGTTGYEFLNDLTALLVDPDGEPGLTAIWEEAAGSDATWDQVSSTAKREVLEEVLAADLNRLTNVFATLVENRRRYRDFTRSELADALAATLVSFDVYRTYVTEGGRARPEDLSRIESALRRAREHAPDLDPELFDLLGAVLTGQARGDAEAELRMRFQQLSGPVMAKGVEDTAFYRYLRLAALCEVGGDPGRFGYPGVDGFHRRMARIQDRRPATMTTLSTHDTKRSEDVRARLAVLSEIPHRWTATVRKWRTHNSRNRPGQIDGVTEYLLYQTLIGAYPIDADRLTAYMKKATKEAKVHTSWTDPDPDYDQALESFIDRMLDDREFTSDLTAFCRPVVDAGRINSLSQKTIQLTAPGVPDIYQGTELWDLSLVDPDNRRPVDHDRRRRLLEHLDTARPGPEAVLEDMESGLPKLWVVRELLALRRRRRHAVTGGYAPVGVDGPASEHAVAYRRGDDVVVVAPRLTMRLQAQGGWGDTAVHLPPGEWHDLFGGGRRTGSVALAEMLARFPVAVLERP